ncbi:MAG: TonB-dependent receptor [Calditrichota bacterium]
MLLGGLWGLATPMVSNAASLSGYIVDAFSDEPLPAAAVAVQGTDRGASANLDGFYVLDQLPTGTYKLIISHLGYLTVEKEITLKQGQIRRLNISLPPSRVQLAEAIVTHHKEEGGDERLNPKVSTVPVEAKFIRLMPSLGAEMDVLRALQTIPGVKSSSDISSALYVRGGSPDQTLILMDHNVVYNPSHLFGIFSTFNADAVKHLELMKGGFASEYGGRSGSVLEVICNEGNRKSAQGLSSLGIVSARASLEGPLPQQRGSYAGSFRRTYLDPMLDVIRKQGIDLPDYYFYDANGKFNYDITPRTTLTMAGYWGDDLLDLDFGPKDTRLYMLMGWGNRTLSARLRQAVGSSMFLSTAAAFSRYHSEWIFENEGILFDKATDELIDWSYRTDFEYYHGNHALKTGALISQYNIRFKEESQNLVYVDVDESTVNYSFYVQDHWRVHPMLEVKPGLRFYYHEAGEHTALDPRLAMVYHYDRNLRFKLAGGRYSQFINLITFGEGFSNFDVWIPIDKSMPPTHSNQVITGVELDSRYDLEHTLEAYFTDMNHIATFDPMADRGEVAQDAFVQGDGEAYGVEWTTRKKTGRFNGWIGYSLSWVRQRYPHSLVNDGAWFFPKWDRRHDFVAVVNYPLSRTWEFSTSWRFNTGQGFTQAKGVYTIIQDGVSKIAILPGSKNNYRFPADHRLDLNFGYNHLFFGQSAKLNISIYNAYSRRSYWQRYFDVYQNPIEITDVKLLPIIPLVSYEVRF